MRVHILIIGTLVCSSSSFSSDKPNILWLTSEDHGPDMGCYGDTLAITPNIDGLAAKGMMFTKAWSTAPVSAPARTTIISGMYPSSTGSEHMRSMVPMPSGTKMYPQFLRETGYYCTNNSKEDYNLIKPEGVWDESSNNAHWKNRPDGQPFFAIFNSLKSHESQIRIRPHKQILNPEKVRVPAFHPDTPEVRQDWAQYYDCVSMADADAGMRLKELEEAGLTDETIVFYFADHGTGMPRGKRWPCNLGLHVPMVIYFPEKWQHLAPSEYKPGGHSDRLVSFVDLAPTLLSITGIKPPKWMQGHAFAGPYQTRPQKYLHGLRSRMDEAYDLVRSITDGRYVYIRNYMPYLSQGQHLNYQFQTPTTRIWRELYDQGKTNEAQSIFWKIPKDIEELYDLLNDPDEIHNLAYSKEHQKILKKLRKAQRRQAKKIHDTGFLPEGEMHLRSRGNSPYDMARDKKSYRLRRIFRTAELASAFNQDAIPKLQKLYKNKDSAVRYWAVTGILIRGKEAVNASLPMLHSALSDTSPFVRIVAARALAEYGDINDYQEAITVLGELSPPESNGIFVSMSALMVIKDLNIKDAPLITIIRNMKTEVPSPDQRYDSYIPRLVNDIMEDVGD